MAIVQRRVFYGKVGTADRLVEWANEMYGLIGAKDAGVSYRVLTDHQSGRTDRMVVELEAESPAVLESVIEQVMSELSSQPEFQAAFARLGELIESAEVEQWAVH
jgi:hypothetical protein